VSAARPALVAALAVAVAVALPGCGGGNSSKSGGGAAPSKALVAAFPCYHNGKRTACPAGGAPCIVDPAEVSRTFHARVTMTAAENITPGSEIRFWYCYYQLTFTPGVANGPTDGDLRIGLLHCPDIAGQFAIRPAPGRPIKVGGASGQVQYDQRLGSGSQSGLALAVSGTVGARTDFDNVDPPPDTKDPTFQPQQELEQLATKSLSLFLLRLGKSPTPSSCSSL
jgi:hypothetical protein